MPSKTWSYAQSAARANATDDYYRDLGLDPLNANTAVHTPSGGSLGVGRATNRMLEGARGLAGTRTLWNAPEQNDYLALHTGSGSPQDMPGMGGTREFVEAGQSRPMRTPALINRSPYDVYREEQSEAARRAEAAKTSAYDSEVAQIRRAGNTVGRLPNELQSVFALMTPKEKAEIVSLGPDQQYARLSGSRLRPTTSPKQAGGGLIQIGDQSGIDDYLAKRGPGMPGSPDWYNPKSDRQDYPDLPVPTMKPLSATKPMTTLPQSTSKPWWVPRPLLTPF